MKILTITISNKNRVVIYHQLIQCNKCFRIIILNIILFHQVFKNWTNDLINHKFKIKIRIRKNYNLSLFLKFKKQSVFLYKQNLHNQRYNNQIFLFQIEVIIIDIYNRKLNNKILNKFKLLIHKKLNHE